MVNMSDQPLSSANWFDIPGGFTGVSGCKPVQDKEGNAAFKKPYVALIEQIKQERDPVDSIDAACEFIASRIGQRLAAPIPKVELLTRENTLEEPAQCVSYAVPEALRFDEIFESDENDFLEAKNAQKLSQLGSSIVLDIVLGACDRLNQGNYLYSQQDRDWKSIDYSSLFHTLAQPLDLDAGLAYGKGPSQSYPPEIIDAVYQYPQQFHRALRAAESIQPKEIAQLMECIPDTHLSEQHTILRENITNFITHRLTSIRELSKAWWSDKGLGDIMQETTQEETPSRPIARLEIQEPVQDEDSSFWSCITSCLPSRNTSTRDGR